MDRHGLRPRDDKGGIFTIKGVKRMRLHTLCHCEKGAKRGTRQSIVPRRTRTGLSVRLLRTCGSPRAFSPCDDNSGIFTIKGVKRLSFTHFVIAKRERRKLRGNLSCLGGRGWGCLFGYSGPVDRHGLRPRDNKGEEKKIVFTEVLVPVLDYCPKLCRACTSAADKARS